MAAGGSEAREYERRNARDLAQRRPTVQVVLLMAVLGSVVFAVVELVVGELNRFWRAGFGLGHSSHSTTAASHPLLSPGLGTVLGVGIALAAAFLVGEAAWSKRKTTEAWRLGSIGEQATRRLLEPLEARGYIVLHDLRIPGSRANIDHIVVGPTGVWVIETKNWTGKVAIRGSKLLRNGRNEARCLEQAKREASAVRAALGDESPVHPILCIHGTPIDVGWFSSTRIDGVSISSGRRLRQVIEDERLTLDPDAVGKIADRLFDVFPH
jgi:hypothetical protein